MKRCKMLAHFISGFKPEGRIMCCPTNMYQFHYHAATAEYSPLAGRVPCKHRHQDVNAALKCANRQ